MRYINQSLPQGAKRIAQHQWMRFPSVEEIKEVADLIGQDFEEVYKCALIAYFDMNHLYN